MIIKYITCDGITVIDEEIIGVEIYSSILDNDDKQYALCRRSRNNPHWDENSPNFEVCVENIFTISH